MKQFEYRIFEESESEVQGFSQLDLYFYKPNASGVGVKARFNGSQRNLPYWQVTQIEFKFIKNLKDIKEGKTKVQLWKRVNVEVRFRVFSLEYISTKKQVFGIRGNTTVEEAIKEQLGDLNDHISVALRRSGIREDYFLENVDLAKWLSKEESILDIFAIEKQKCRFVDREVGLIKASLLYDKARLEEKEGKLFKTTLFESESPRKLIKLVKESKQDLKKNVSYPSWLEKMWF